MKDNRLKILLGVIGCIVGYAVYQYYKKPTFEELIEKYVMHTDETHKEIIAHNLYKALKKNGYTSKLDLVRAKLALRSVN